MISIIASLPTSKTLATGGLVGAQIIGAIASSGGAGAAGVAATGCSIGTGVTTGTAVGGTIAGIGIGAAWACSTHGKESCEHCQKK